MSCYTAGVSAKVHAFQIVQKVFRHYRDDKHVPEDELSKAFTAACGVIIASAREMMRQDAAMTPKADDKPGDREHVMA